MSDILDALSDLFVHEATAWPQTFDEYGAPTSGAPIEVPCYVYGGAERVRNKSGVMVESSYIMVTNGYYGLTVNHRFALPTQFPVASGECMAVRDHTDENGPHHQTVYF